MLLKASDEPLISSLAPEMGARILDINGVLRNAPHAGLTFPSNFFQYCLHSMTAITARSRRMMPTRQPIRMAVLLPSSLATGRPARGVLVSKSGSTGGKQVCV